MATTAIPKHLVTLGRLLHGLAFLLVSGAVFEVIASLVPARVSEVRWRWGIEGLITQGASIAVLGLALALVAAVLLRQRRVLALLGAVNGVACLLFVLLLLSFTLDTVQIRARVMPTAMSHYTLIWVRTVMIDGLSAALTAAFAVTCVRARRTLAGSEQRVAGPFGLAMPGDRRP